MKTKNNSFIKFIKKRSMKSYLKRRYQKYKNVLQKTKKLDVLKYLTNEIQTSTTHGLAYTVDNKNHLIEKIFWITNFTVCLVLVLLLLNMQFARFMAAPTVMSVEMNYFDWNVSYPAITLCPLYKPDIQNFQAYINKTYKATDLKIEGYLWAISESALDTLEYLDLGLTADFVELIHPREYATVAATLFRKFNNSWLSTNANWSINVESAMTEMGMCHVLNSNVAKYDNPLKRKESTQLYVKNNIELSVFEADIYIQLKNYAPLYKVFIHSPDEITTSTTSSFIFDVEGEIKFGLSVWSNRISEELRKKSLRIRKCRFINEPTSERYPIYSYSHCIMECRIRMIQKLCGCVPHFYHHLKNERTCYIHELKCVLYHRKEVMTLETSKETLKKFNYAKDLPRISRDCGCLSTCELDLYYKDNEDSYLGAHTKTLIIKITSFPKVRVVRDIIFDFYDILLRSGGVVNLCIGSSIISIMELSMVLIKVSVYLIIRCIQLILPSI